MNLGRSPCGRVTASRGAVVRLVKADMAPRDDPEFIALLPFLASGSRRARRKSAGSGALAHWAGFDAVHLPGGCEMRCGPYFLPIG